MNLLIKIAAIIYRTYEDRGISIPYFRAITTIVLIMFFHVVHLGLLFNIASDNVMPWSSKTSKPIQWLYGLVYFGALIIAILLIFKKSRLEKMNVSDKQIKRGRKILPIYFAACILVLMVLLIKLGIEKGKINF